MNLSSSFNQSQQSNNTSISQNELYNNTHIEGYEEHLITSYQNYAENFKSAMTLEDGPLSLIKVPNKLTYQEDGNYAVKLIAYPNITNEYIIFLFDLYSNNGYFLNKYSSNGNSYLEYAQFYKSMDKFTNCNDCMEMHFFQNKNNEKLTRLYSREYSTGVDKINYFEFQEYRVTTGKVTNFSKINLHSAYFDYSSTTPVYLPTIEQQKNYQFQNIHIEDDFVIVNHHNILTDFSTSLSSHSSVYPSINQPELKIHFNSYVPDINMDPILQVNLGPSWLPNLQKVYYDTQSLYGYPNNVIRYIETNEGLIDFQHLPFENRPNISTGPGHKWVNGELLALDNLYQFQFGLRHFDNLDTFLAILHKHSSPYNLSSYIDRTINYRNDTHKIHFFDVNLNQNQLDGIVWVDFIMNNLFLPLKKTVYSTLFEDKINETMIQPIVISPVQIKLEEYLVMNEEDIQSLIHVIDAHRSEPLKKNFDYEVMFFNNTPIQIIFSIVDTLDNRVTRSIFIN
jgi:hypothetical protein